MPAYNVAPYLATAVTSLLLQTYGDFELLIVDDGSDDGTAEIAATLAERQPDRVSVIHQDNRGLAAARNAALRASRGRVLALLDSDDVWEPGFLAAQMAVLDERPEIDIVTGNARFLGGPRHGHHVRPHPDPRPKPTLATILADEEAVFVMSVYRRRVCERIGGFNEQLHTNEDYEYWLRAAQAGFTFARNSQPLGWYRVRPQSLSADEVRMISGILGVYEGFSRTLEPGSAEERIAQRQMRRFEGELLAPCARRGIQPRSLSNRQFAHAVAALRRGQRPAAALARYAPFLLRWVDRARFWRQRAAPAAATDIPWMHPPAAGQEGMSAVASAARFDLVDEERLRQAEELLQEMLNRGDMKGLSFLDVGSGGGLFSLAARRLGARVCSFDHDPQSVACTLELRRRYFPDDPGWQVTRGSILDGGFVRRLGTFNVVHSRGVLHQTGNMWEALELVGLTVAPGGVLFVAIDNARGSRRSRWRAVVGNTYEAAKPESIVEFFKLRAYSLEARPARDRAGSNQFLFRRAAG